MKRRAHRLIAAFALVLAMLLTTASFAAAHDTASCHHSTSQPPGPRFTGQWWEYFESHWTNQFGHYHRYAHYVWWEGQGWQFVHTETNVCGGGTLAEAMLLNTSAPSWVMAIVQ